MTCRQAYLEEKASQDLHDKIKDLENKLRIAVEALKEIEKGIPGCDCEWIAKEALKEIEK